MNPADEFTWSFEKKQFVRIHMAMYPGTLSHIFIYMSGQGLNEGVNVATGLTHHPRCRWLAAR